MNLAVFEFCDKIPAMAKSEALVSNKAGGSGSPCRSIAVFPVVNATVIFKTNAS